MFKCGDIIRTKSYTHCCEEFRYMVTYMQPCCNKIGVISQVETRRYDSASFPDGKAYRINFNTPGGTEWVWSSDCLELFKPMVMETE